MNKFKQLSYILVLLVSLNIFLLSFYLTYQPVNAFEIGKDNLEILGIVKDGSFIIADTNETKKLTSVGLVTAATPESGVINLTEYEGKAILVSSEQIDDKFIWGSSIIDIADPIVTELVKEIFSLK